MSKLQPVKHGRDHRWVGYYGPSDPGGADAIPVKQRTLVIVMDGRGAELTTGVWGDAAIHFDCYITGWRLLADQTGSIVVDIWKDVYANFPPTVADTITASALPTLSGAVKAEDTTLTGWTKQITAGDVLRFNVDSVSTVTRVTLTLALLA